VHNANTPVRVRIVHTRCADLRTDEAFDVAMATGFAWCRDWVRKEIGSMCEDKCKERER
jgi:hypothetical protein